MILTFKVYIKINMVCQKKWSLMHKLNSTNEGASVCVREREGVRFKEQNRELKLHTQ